jgi:Lipoprotein LpqB beta-propeller domain/Sporulation and spore germination
MASRPRGRGAVAAAALAVALAAAGCASVPTSGPVQTGADQNAVSQEQVYSQPIPVGPGPHWTPTRIVSGFLSASASFAGDHAVAREYLVGPALQSWQPGWAVTVVSGPPTLAPLEVPKPMDGQVTQLAKVKATGLPVASLSNTGQYQASKGTSSESYDYELIRVNGQWRIDGLPNALLLTQTDFQHVYQSRDLYFVTQSGQSLVPDPVFVPQQATDTELATGLVNALLQDPTGWLEDAAQTGFPARSYRVGQVRMNGSNAVVDLGGKAVTAGSAQLQRMAAQLVWTLESGPTSIQSVQLELNGRPVPVGGNQYQLLPQYLDWVQSQSSGSSVYYVASDGAVQALTGAGQQGTGRVAAVPGAAGTTSATSFSSIAVSPDRRSIAGIARGGQAVYVGGMSRGATLRELPALEGSVTSLSWDEFGDLWLVAGGQVWMLAPGGSTPEPVPLSITPGSEVTDFRVAPDGVRAAMIVKGSAGGKSVTVQVAAITRDGSSASVGLPLTLGSSISDPLQLSWYGTDNLIVLAGGPGQLYEVPLNGGQPTPIPVIGGDPVSVTSTNPGGSTPDIAVGLSNNTIMVSANLGDFQSTRTDGLAPVYPG